MAHLSGTRGVSYACCTMSSVHSAYTKEPTNEDARLAGEHCGCSDAGSEQYGLAGAGNCSSPRLCTCCVGNDLRRSGLADDCWSLPEKPRRLPGIRKKTGKKKVDINEFHPTDTAVAAEEVHDLTPGSAVEIDLDRVAYPAAFSTMPRADYELQVVLDSDHNYNYSGRDPEDWESPVVEAKTWEPGAGDEPVLTLSEHPEAGRRAEMVTKALAEVKPGEVEKAEFQSPVLTAFWGKPTYVRGWVILPPGYDAKAKKRYPTFYWTHGFGGDMDYALVTGLGLRKAMVERKAPPMICVMLDESLPEGTHEFADSVNDGPWGTALTREFIPWLEGEVPHGCAAHGAPSEWPLQRRLGYLAASGELPAGLRRHVVHLARPQRLPQLHRAEPLWRAREPLSQGRRNSVAHHARSRPGAGHDGATGEARSSARPVWRTDRFLRLGLLAEGAERRAGADVRSHDRGYRSSGGRLLGRAL